MDPKKDDILKWTKALRGGGYGQAEGALQDGKKYCCLGVACRVFMEESQMEKDYRNTLEGGDMGDQPNAPEWLKKINFDFENKTGESLIDLNDNEKMSFQEIADCLEAVYVHKVLE